MIDPVTGERSLVISQIVKLAAIFTMIAVLGSILWMSFRYRQSGGSQPL
jgi:hypothetical protein